MTPLSKTNYLLWRECKKNAWLKVHKPEVYFASELTEFEKQIIEAGNEVDELAQEAFPERQFQRKFEAEGFLAITDILEEREGGVEVYEVKATSDIDKKRHYHDLAFQVNVLDLLGMKVLGAHLVHLNKDYVRMGGLDLRELFWAERVTERIEEMLPEVLAEMRLAQEYLESREEPKGPCDCLYKGRSNHCSTFSYSNPDVPEYSVHDLARIGLSKRKLTELVDSGILDPREVLEAFELSDVQRNQVRTLVNDRALIDKDSIREELSKLEFPLYFLDYETFPAAIPRFSGYSPYTQIPFQYSLHVLEQIPSASPLSRGDSETAPSRDKGRGEGEGLKHFEFLHIEDSDPSEAFAKSLRSHIGSEGTIIVWHKSFECSRNKEISERLPEYRKFFEELNARTYDLEDIFKKQHYVHKDFRGSSSIKKVLPVLVPSLSYGELEIKEGGTAAQSWNQMVREESESFDKDKIIQNLHEYCKLDTYAMYAVWKELYELTH